MKWCYFFSPPPFFSDKGSSGVFISASRLPSFCLCEVQAVCCSSSPAVSLPVWFSFACWVCSNTCLSVCLLTEVTSRYPRSRSLTWLSASWECSWDCSWKFLLTDPPACPGVPGDMKVKALIVHHLYLFLMLSFIPAWIVTYLLAVWSLRRSSVR